MSNNTDEEDDSSPSSSPVPSQKAILSPPLPPRRLSPLPPPNTYVRNSKASLSQKETSSSTPSVTVVLSTTENHHCNKVSNTEARYDMLHRASSPSIIPPTVIRPHSISYQRIPPALPEKTGHLSAHLRPQLQSSVMPTVPQPSTPRPLKTINESSKQEHHYENTIIIPGTKQHVVKNININRAKLAALMKGKEEINRSTPKTESAAYENVNVEHISRLTALGFDQDTVIRALGITRNDLEMACDILHEFATKSSLPGVKIKYICDDIREKVP